ncbi:MAG TPA: Gfo/Idh/MocA family oxidoreductase [Tepidisphaeraceae bacterium]|nr:Gfo/Idh/MocA family oxidoreductase [Tepidisphaeraceae bacterium]
MHNVNIGIIGCGAIVQSVHLNVLSRISSARIVAIAEPSDSRRSQTSEKLPGVSACADWREILNDKQIDAVIIAAPSGMHAEIAIASFAAGKHVYLEKPLAITVEQGRGVVEAWRTSNRVGMIGFNYRFSPLYSEIQRLVSNGRIGKPISARTVFSTCADALPPWKTSRASGGGVLLDLASHHIDLMRFMFGEVVAVSSNITSIVSEADTATLLLRMKNEVLVESLFSLASIEEDRVEVYGREGKVWADRYRSPTVRFDTTRRGMDLLRQLADGLTNLPALARKIIRRGYESSYAQALSRFIAAAGARAASVAPDLNDGLQSLIVVEAAERASVEHREIEIQNT